MRSNKRQYSVWCHYRNADSRPLIKTAIVLPLVSRPRQGQPEAGDSPLGRRPVAVPNSPESARRGRDSRVAWYPAIAVAAPWRYKHPIGHLLPWELRNTQMTPLPPPIGDSPQPRRTLLDAIGINNPARLPVPCPADGALRLPGRSGWHGPGRKHDAGDRLVHHYSRPRRCRDHSACGPSIGRR